MQVVVVVALVIQLEVELHLAEVVQAALIIILVQRERQTLVGGVVVTPIHLADLAAQVL
jgi:hypothetical protein